MIINTKAKQELEQLLNDNENFVNGITTADNRTVKTLQQFTNHQSPNVCVLTCSDSRVIPEFIFDKGIGDIFVVRTAGLTLDSAVKESIEYAVSGLKVPLLIILGHDNCGVMGFANSNYPKEPDNFKQFAKCVYPVLKETNKTVTDIELAKEYTKNVEKYLMTNSNIIKDSVQCGNLYIAKCHLNLSSGKVEKI